MDVDPVVALHPDAGAALQARDGPASRWHMPRNCSLTPRQLAGAALGVMGSVAAVSAAFTALGYAWVAVFGVLEVSAFAVALAVYTRHACDAETLMLNGERLVVEQRCGGQVLRTELQIAWLRVVAPNRPTGLVELWQAGQCVRVGRHLPAGRRSRLARELRRALVVAARPTGVEGVLAMPALGPGERLTPTLQHRAHDAGRHP
ncbi:DUF2244 domain-containing protein [Rhizobacter sp. LjRoot28]|uniref:DUF2244 domain-containing protein n=1 Tax=Rhizobacter sp. LjRoot28 TaxID=3342309 RepID=UPI003ECC5007